MLESLRGSDRRLRSGSGGLAELSIPSIVTNARVQASATSPPRVTSAPSQSPSHGRRAEMEAEARAFVAGAGSSSSSVVIEDPFHGRDASADADGVVLHMRGSGAASLPVFSPVGLDSASSCDMDVHDFVDDAAAAAAAAKAPLQRLASGDVLVPSMVPHASGSEHHGRTTFPAMPTPWVARRNFSVLGTSPHSHHQSSHHHHHHHHPRPPRQTIQRLQLGSHLQFYEILRRDTGRRKLVQYTAVHAPVRCDVDGCSARRHSV